MKRLITTSVCVGVLAFLVLGTSIGWGSMLAALGMSSSTFSISFDSINTGGTDTSASSEYGLADTIGELATGESVSSSYGIQAGYRQLGNSYISVTMPTDLVLTSIGGITEVSTTGEISWTVTTDNSSGYEFFVKTTSQPALSSDTDSFEDYMPAGGTPDFAFSINATTSAFGFSPESDDVISDYLDNGSTCGVGSSETSGACWDGFSLSDKVVSRGVTANQPTGQETTLALRAANGSEHIQSSGEYSAVITITAITR